MSRSFRQSDHFADKREAFAERKAARQDRARHFEQLGYDKPDAFAARPMGNDRARAAVRGLGW